MSFINYNPAVILHFTVLILSRTAGGFSIDCFQKMFELTSYVRSCNWIGNSLRGCVLVQLLMRWCSDETMREIKSVVRRCAAREKTGSAAVTSYYRCSTVESTMGICRSEQKGCLNVGGGSKGYELKVGGFKIYFSLWNKMFWNLKKKKNVMI